jgi:putative DNA primase/helicase
MAQPQLPPPADDIPFPTAPSDDWADDSPARPATIPGTAPLTAKQAAEAVAFADALGVEAVAGGQVVDLDARRQAKRLSAEEQAVVDREFAAKYLAKVDGRAQFLVKTLAHDVMEEGPLAFGIDGRMWSYRDGVWAPDKDVVRHRTALLLNQRYQASHATNAEHIIRAELATIGRVIKCEPVKDIINFKNGHLEWATGTLREHDPDALCTVQLATEWNPDAECPEFEKYLSEVLPEDMIPTAWELIGYLMYNGNPLHKAVMLHGTGRNGKGVFIRAIKALLGESNISGASLQALAEERFAPSTLFGKSANICGEIDGSYMEKTAKFKEITGEDHMNAEFKGRDPFQFTNWAVPLFSANKIPGSADVTIGYLSRWVVIPFPRNFEGREDRTLSSRVTTEAELQGIAAKGVRALRDLLARGNFPETASSRAAMEDFRRKVDQVRTWLDERAEVGPEQPLTPRTQMYADYKDWAKDSGVGQISANEFYNRLDSIGASDPESGLRAYRNTSGRYYQCVKLLPRPGALPPPPPPGWQTDH